MFPLCFRIIWFYYNRKNAGYQVFFVKTLASARLLCYNDDVSIRGRFRTIIVDPRFTVPERCLSGFLFSGRKSTRHPESFSGMPFYIDRSRRRDSPSIFHRGAVWQTVSIEPFNSSRKEIINKNRRNKCIKHGAERTVRIVRIRA